MQEDTYAISQLSNFPACHTQQGHIAALPVLRFLVKYLRIFLSIFISCHHHCCVTGQGPQLLLAVKTFLHLLLTQLRRRVGKLRPLGATKAQDK